jgi:acetamidase/formamidase
VATASFLWTRQNSGGGDVTPGLFHLADWRGYSREQASALTSVAVIVRISQVVDVPNLVISAFLPLDIFES